MGQVESEAEGALKNKYPPRQVQMIRKWKAGRFFRMWPRALFHMKDGMEVLREALDTPGVYVLYRDDQPYYIGKTSTTLLRRLKNHALKPNARRYNFWNYFSAFEIKDDAHRDEVEAILISAMPTANSAQPKFDRKKLDRRAAKLLNKVQALMLTARKIRAVSRIRRAPRTKTTAREWGRQLRKTK